MPVRTAVLKKLPSRPPPATSVAPASSASLTCASSRSAAAVDDSGPSAVSADDGSPGSTSVSAAVNFSTNVVVELVDDDEALGRVAGLAGVLQPAADRLLDDRVEVVGLEHDERVRAAELEHDLLEVAAGDLGHRGAGAARAGQRHALHARVADDPLDLLVGRVDVDVRVLRHAGVVEDLLHRRGRLGALRRVLEQDRVADHQVRAGEARHLVVGVVPRHDPEQQADRAAAHERRALAVEQLDRLVGHDLRRVVGVVLVDRGAEVDLAEGLLDRLAHLARDDLRELLAALGVQLRDAGDDLRALLDARAAPPAPMRRHARGRSPPAARRRRSSRTS